MSAPRVVRDTDQISKGLRHPDLKQALYDEGAIIMDRTLLTLHGEEHRKRRIMEFRVFARTTSIGVSKRSFRARCAVPCPGISRRAGPNWWIWATG